MNRDEATRILNVCADLERIGALATLKGVDPVGLDRWRQSCVRQLREITTRHHTRATPRRRLTTNMSGCTPTTDPTITSTPPTPPAT